ncbi:MAG: glycosyltransferase [Clostridium sp.]|nr:glycosyltransferase [Clostridium sp.]
MTKIVFVLPDMAGGGTERVVALLSNEFVKRGYPVAVLLFAGNHTEYPLDKRVEIFVAGKTSGGKLSVRIKRIGEMRRFYKENKGCYLFAFSAMGAVFSAVAAFGIPHRMLVSERNDPSRYEHSLIRNLAYRKAEKLVLQTEDMRGLFPKSLQKKAVVIPNPAPDGVREPFTGERKKQVVSVARLQPQKNHRLLIDAFAEFLKQYPEYELHIFGVGELEEELRRQVHVLQIEDKVVFRGFSSRVKEEIWDSAMFVLSSDYEGISNSMIEALAMGLPVISTDCPVGGSRAYIENNVSGILTPVGDKEALAAAMRKVAGEPEFAKKLSENGAKIKETYGLAQIADRLLEEAGI